MNKPEPRECRPDTCHRKRPSTRASEIRVVIYLKLPDLPENSLCVIGELSWNWKNNRAFERRHSRHMERRSVELKV